MKKVLVILAPGFEEIETVTVIDILRRSGARVTVAATASGLVEGSRGVRINPDCLLESVSGNDFDLVVLPGGQPGTDNLKNNDRVLGLLKKMSENQKLIGAICAAPLVLHHAGLLEGSKCTSHPSVRNMLAGANYSEDRVVVDENIITSRSPGTAMEFSLKLVEILYGKDRVDTVNQGVMARV